MGVGNFFGMLPDTMQDSRLYAEAQRKTLPADPTVKNFSYTVVDARTPDHPAGGV